MRNMAVLKCVAFFVVVLHVATIKAAEEEQQQQKQQQLNPSSSLEDIEHIVVFMQENRAFDHYFGKMKGVRGYNDRSAPLLPNMKSQFYQPLPNGKQKITQCKGNTCTNMQQGKICSPGLPGAENKTCCYLKWEQGNLTCPSTPPPAKACEGATTLQECTIQNQICSAGTKGAGPNGNRCCGGWWNDDADKKCPPPPPHAEYMLPYHVNLSATSGECMAAPEMDFRADIGMWNKGLMNQWNVARVAGYGMSHFDRSDLPYYYELADAFTVGDQHFQSTLTQTCPNRMHLFAGSNNNLWNRKERGSSNETLMMLDNTEPVPGWDWPTMAETLEDAGVSWKVYMEEDNFDDNGFAWFKNFQEAKAGNPLYDKGMVRVNTNDLVKSFESDVKRNVLPQVSWLIAPANQSEHATNHPAAGEDLSARLLRVMQDNPDVYKKTAFIINYDEGGQFFDHLVPPTPNLNSNDGKSTVTTLGEITTETYVDVPPGNPIGLGFRVPLIIVSPWTRVNGGAVYSEVVDHTSIIQFIEKRFKVKCPNISPWRRAITGDLTHAFDFNSAPDYSWPLLPDTSNYVEEAERECADLPSPKVPIKQAMPSQEEGTKLARALPYKFEIEDSVSSDGKSITLKMKNVGTLGVVFHVYDYATSNGETMAPPKKYTIEAGKELDDVWESVNGTATFNLGLYGPNGFVRMYKGNGIAATGPTIAMKEDAEGQNLVFVASPNSNNNNGCTFSTAIKDNAYNFGGPWKLDANKLSLQQAISIASSGNWYDFTVETTSMCGNDATVTFAKTYMGKMETGKQTITDPAMAGKSKLINRGEVHLDISNDIRLFDKTITRGRRAHKVQSNLREVPGKAVKYVQGDCKADKDSCDYH
jgi:phospholipase C